MTKGNGRMKKIVTLVFVLLTLLAAAASAESYTQADFEWAEAVQDQSALTLKEQAKYLDIVKQRQRGIALLAMGGEDTPFQIAGAAQLAELAQYVNAGDATFVSAHYVLTDDVNLSAYGNWTPIGTMAQPFAGVFDGQNHVVTGLKIDRSQGECQGLFGCVNSRDANRKAQVKNVIVKDAQIRTKSKSGAVVGFYGGWASQMEPLENCAMVGGSIEGCVDRAGYDQAASIGGVVGQSDADVRFCYSTGTVIVPQSACEIGGVAGWVDGNVQSCYAAGSMDIFPYSTYQIFNIGGLAGRVDDDVSDCYSTVDVVGLGDYTINFGGVAGTVGGSVTRCFATGNVQAWMTVGGVAGTVGTWGGSLTDCVALNGAVSGTVSNSKGISRVGNVLKSEGGSESGNYANEGIPKAGKDKDTLLAADGTDLTYDDTNGLSQQFETIFGGNSAWTYTENGLPTLKNVGGTQSSELPSWMLGSETTIYITTAQQLKQLADEVNAGDSKSGKTYLLANDIDLSGLNWVPIGYYIDWNNSNNKPFSGVFDGQGHSIIGLTISGGQNDAGLFGYTHLATIRNVVIRNPQIEGRGEVGALVGRQGYSSTGIEKCAVIGGRIQGAGSVGGLVGYMEESPLQNCYTTCEVIATDSYAGGIVGSHLVGASIRSCYATGNISGRYSGGIAGLTQGIEQCVALGQTVTGDGSSRVMYRSNGNANVYAWSGMKVNNQTVTDGRVDNENGEDILAHNGLLYGKNAQIFAWPGFDTAVWELRNDQPGKLPRFKGTSADPTLNLSAQTSTVTCDVELNGDAGVSGIRYKVNDAANDTEYSGVFTVNLLDKLEIEPTIRTGYAFAQWSDGKTDNPYTMAVPGTVSLTAQTQIETYTIDYELNGGALEAGKTNPATYTLETAAFRLEEPTRTGYTFAGWTGSNGTTPQTDVGIAQGSTGNLYFEANWTANGYKILYTGVEGADVSTFPTKHVFGKDTAIPNPTKTGYGFAGWKVNGSAAARDLTLSGTAYTADITLEATWTKLTEPTPSVIMEGGTAFIVGKATEDAIMHIGKGVANFGVANLDSVDMDGKRLDPQFYTAKDGSIILTVHQAYLNTLSVGEHILTAHLKGPGYEGQTVSGKIVVAPVPDMSNLPQTGDASPVLLWGATLGFCAAVLAVMKRKKK